MSDYGGADSKELEVVPGTLRGYRAFMIADIFMGPELESMTSPYRWVPGVQASSCDPTGSFFRSPPVDTAWHKAPNRGCTCGFYAAYKEVPRSYRNGALYGVIKSSGRIILGDTRGFRAEKAEIEALCLGMNFPRLGDRELALAIADRYQVPILATEDEMMHHFPPDDVSELVGPLPDERYEITNSPFSWHTHISRFTVSFDLTIQASQALMEALKGPAMQGLSLDWAAVDDDTEDKG